MVLPSVTRDSSVFRESDKARPLLHDERNAQRKKVISCRFFPSDCWLTAWLLIFAASAATGKAEDY